MERVKKYDSFSFVTGEKQEGDFPHFGHRAAARFCLSTRLVCHEVLAFCRPAIQHPTGNNVTADQGDGTCVFPGNREKGLGHCSLDDNTAV